LLPILFALEGCYWAIGIWLVLVDPEFFIRLHAFAEGHGVKGEINENAMPQACPMILLKTTCLSTHRS